MTLHVGFTGTREGMTQEQGRAVANLVDELMDRDRLIRAHHGDCVGSDAGFHAICRDRGIWIISHPPINARYRAFNGGDANWAPDTYKNRNQDIVNECSVLIAAPLTWKRTGSGTWQTVNMAQRKKATQSMSIIIIDRDGTRSVM